MAAQPVPGNYVSRSAIGTRYNAGVPVAGTNEVQTATFGGTWLAGDTFRLNFAGARTGAIAWSATTATLLANIQAALDALATLGTNWVVASAGTVSSGLGTVLLTFSGGDVAKKAVSLITVSDIVSAAGTLTNAQTTPGVDATARESPKGTLLMDTTNGVLYANTGVAGAPTWTAQ